MTHASIRVPQWLFASLVIASALSFAQNQSQLTLSACRLNRATVSCDKFRIEARVKNRLFQLQRHTAEGKSAFVIPADVATAPNADLIVHTAEGIFEIDKLESWWWKDDWELGLEHRPFSDDFDWVYKKRKVKCFGYVVYTNSEPGRVVSTTNCR